MDTLEYYQDKSILITGGSGYIASALLEKLRDKANKIIVLTRNKELQNSTNSSVSYYYGDVRDKELWEKVLPDIDIIFYFAGQTSSKFANDNPREDAAINLVPIINLVNSCHTNNFSPDIIFAGTSTQVGFTSDVPVNEDLPDNPITVYDINKLTAEHYLRYYSHQQYGQAVSLRLTNVYGPGLPSNKLDRGILNLMVRKSLQKETLTIYGDGNFIRDYVYIDDVVNAFLTASQKIKQLKGNYFVIGSGKGYTIRQMMELIQSIVQKITYTSVKINKVPFPSGLSKIEYRNFVADSRKFQQLSGWKPLVMLPEGIEKTIRYFQKKL